MAVVAIDNFGGIAPRIHPTLLGDNMAVKAHNCLLKSGKLVPIRKPRFMGEMPISYENGLAQIRDAKTIHLWRRGAAQTLLAWPGEVSIAPSNLSGDEYNRVFVTGETGVGGANHPCVYLSNPNGDIVRHDLVKASMRAPSAHVAGGLDQDNLRYTYLVQTWIDAYGYESGASMPSNELEYNDGDEVTVDSDPAPAGASARRIYKVVAGTETDAFQFVLEQDSAGSFFPATTFSMKDEDAGEVLPTLQAPSEDLELVCRVPGNFYAGVRRSKLREIRFSESGNPTIWPDAYTATVTEDIVALGVTLNTVFALTKGEPWAITGTAPDAMTSAVLASAQGCVSRRSVCTYDGAVFYASPNGLCMLRDGSATVSVVTDKMFSKREWQELHPESCLSVSYGAAVFCWFPDSDKAIVLNMTDDSDAAITTHEISATCVCADVIGDRLVFIGALDEEDEE